MNDPKSGDLMNTVLAGGGEMGRLIRAYDWSTTSLGPADAWPQSLRSVVSMLLPSKAQIILFWGPDFTVLYNDAYRPVFGAKHPDALGRRGQEAWSEIWDDMLHGLLADVVRTGEAFWASDLLFVLERHGFVEETYFDVSYDPVRVESGGVGGVYCIVTETTERVVSARRMALLKDLATQSTLARTTREACAIAMATLGHHPHDILFARVYLNDQLQASTPDAAEALANAVPAVVHELSFVSPGGTAPSGRLVVGLNPRRPFDAAHQAFLHLVSHQLGTAIASAHAYEEEKRRAEALAEIDRAKTTFFSNVSHEFRTPLTLILGPIEDMLAEGQSDPRNRERIELVHRNSLRLLKLVNTLLDFARIEAGRVQASFEPTDLQALTTHLTSAFRSAIERVGMELVVDCHPLDQPVYVDHDLWEKVVLNLLSNAFKYTLQGRITVSLRRQGKAALLTVSDTGVGIPESELPRVFERFHRIENVQGRTHEGTGIGLALVRELVRLHGGTITVQSIVGRGSTFAVTLPFGMAHLPADHVGAARPLTSTAMGASPYVEEALRWLPADLRDSPPASELVEEAILPANRRYGARGTGARRDRVLIADDNADMRDYVAGLLQAEYDVETVSDGAAALASARRQVPDLVLADVMMPSLDGFGLLKELRGAPALRTVPVLLLSARAGEEARVDGWAAGADDYLVKPFSARELVARVGTHLQMARIRREGEERLREADRKKDEFLATLAHELRNPLAPIRTGLEVIRFGGATAASVEQVRGIMERQIGHMVRLIDDLMDVSRITSGKIQLQRQPALLSELVEGAVETTRAFVAERQAALSVRLPETPCVLDVDRTRFVQILSNLLHNAAKFTKPGGRIDVVADLQAREDSQPSQVVITVTDNGSGITPELLPRVFDLFAQGEGLAGSAQGGLGIGLALVKKLVEMHGGTVEARSRGLEQGTQIALRLPVASVTSTAHAG